MTLPSQTGEIRLLLIDDHALFLEGTAQLLSSHPDFKVVGTARSLEQATKILEEVSADIVLLDFDLGRDRATPIVRQLFEQGFAGKILIVTAGVSEAEALQLIRFGVTGIFHKQNGSQALCAAIRKVASGEPYLEADYLGSVFRSLGQEADAGPPRLSEREVKMLRLLFQGMANKEIATTLSLTESGVKAALRSLFDKIGVKTRSQAVRVAVESYRDQL